MSQVHLISEKTIKALTLIGDNVDTTYIAVAIQDAQEMGLQPLLGSNLYDAICDKVSDGSIATTANAAYKTLLDEYITPYLCKRVMEDVQVPLFGKFRNAGMVQSQDTQTQQLSKSDVDYLREFYDNKAKFYADRMTDYLCANATSYPEWRNRRDVADIPSNDAQTFDFGITI